MRHAPRRSSGVDASASQAMPGRRRLTVPCAVLGAALLLAFAGPARAEDLEQAKMYFNAGAQAYSAGRYAFAVQAFEQAYKLAPRPAIVFSLAQAERKQYFVAKHNDVLVHAVKHYHEYLDQVPAGGRRDDAVNALAELEPLAARMYPETAQPGTAAAAETRIMVSSQTEHAAGSIDGGPAKDIPFMADVTAGKHRVHVSREGFVDEERDVVVLSGATTPAEVTLREKPGLLWVKADSGADIAVDGRAMGTTPLGKPLELPSGEHLVLVTKNGHKAVSREVTLERGKTVTVPIQFETTGQRVVSYGLLGTGVAGLLASGAFFTIALIEQGRAQHILDDKNKGNIGSPDLDTYASAVDARNTWRTAGIATLGGSIAVLGAGLVLYSFDHPSANVEAPARERLPAPAPAAPPKETPMEMGAVPLLGPGVAGAGIVGRF